MVSEHMETLRSIRHRYRLCTKLAKSLGIGYGPEIYEQQDREEAALTAAIEALEGREWKDAPDGDGGPHWALFPDGWQRVVDVFPVDDVWWVQAFDGVITKLANVENGTLWSRLPDPPPVPESEGDDASE